MVLGLLEEESDAIDCSVHELSVLAQIVVKPVCSCEASPLLFCHGVTFVPGLRLQRLHFRFIGFCLYSMPSIGEH